MKILFVEQKLRADKLGPMYLSAVLKEHGHHVHLVQDDANSVEDMIAVWKPDFVAYSITSEAYKWFTSINKKLKGKYKFTSIVGGPHFTFFPEHGTADPDIDFVVQGPGERAMLDVVEGRASEKLIVGHIAENVDTILQPDRSILYRYTEFGNARVKRFIAGRDCPNSCIYCYNHIYHRLYASEKNRFFQITSPQRMVDEIAEVRRRWGLEFVYFNDDDFTRDHIWLHEFLDVYSREINLPFYAAIRAENATMDILIELAKANCFSLSLSLESAVPETLKLLRRGSIGCADVSRCVEDCKRLGIRSRLLNMIGLPVDDPLQDALETLKFNMQVEPTESGTSIFQPYPKTDSWKLCLEKGLIDADAETLPFFDDCGLKIADASRITRLAKWWCFIVRAKMPIEAVKVLIDLPLSKEQKVNLRNLRWRESARMLYGME